MLLVINYMTEDKRIVLSNVNYDTCLDDLRKFQTMFQLWFYGMRNGFEEKTRAKIRSVSMNFKRGWNQLVRDFSYTCLFLPKSTSQRRTSKKKWYSQRRVEMPLTPYNKPFFSVHVRGLRISQPVNLSQVNKECNGKVRSWFTKMALSQKLVARFSRYNQKLWR